MGCGHLGDRAECSAAPAQRCPLDQPWCPSLVSAPLPGAQAVLAPTHQPTLTLPIGPGSGTSGVPSASPALWSQRPWTPSNCQLADWSRGPLLHPGPWEGAEGGTRDKGSDGLPCMGQLLALRASVAKKHYFLFYSPNPIYPGVRCAHRSFALWEGEHGRWGLLGARHHPGSSRQT